MLTFILKRASFSNCQHFLGGRSIFMAIFCANCQSVGRRTCCSGAWIDVPRGSVKCGIQRHNLLAMLTFGHAYAENTLAYLQEGALASYFPNATFHKIDSCRSVYRINTSTQAASSTQWDILRFRPLYYGSPDWRAAAFCLSPCVVAKLRNCIVSCLYNYHWLCRSY